MLFQAAEELWGKNYEETVSKQIFMCCFLNAWPKSELQGYVIFGSHPSDYSEFGVSSWLPSDFTTKRVWWDCLKKSYEEKKRKYIT